MSKVRHRAPAARKAELLGIIKGPAPLHVAEPQNRRQRRTLDRVARRESSKTGGAR